MNKSIIFIAGGVAFGFAVGYFYTKNQLEATYQNDLDAVRQRMSSSLAKVPEVLPRFANAADADEPILMADVEKVVPEEKGRAVTQRYDKPSLEALITDEPDEEEVGLVVITPMQYLEDEPYIKSEFVYYRNNRCMVDSEDVIIAPAVWEGILGDEVLKGLTVRRPKYYRNELLQEDYKLSVVNEEFLAGMGDDDDEEDSASIKRRRDAARKSAREEAARRKGNA